MRRRLIWRRPWGASRGVLLKKGSLMLAEIGRSYFSIADVRGCVLTVWFSMGTAVLRGILFLWRLVRNMFAHWRTGALCVPERSIGTGQALWYVSAGQIFEVGGRLPSTCIRSNWPSLAGWQWPLLLPPLTKTGAVRLRQGNSGC